jgi:exocyst complex component 4
LAAYRGVVQPESEDKRIISAEWAKDEDIARFLKALPNWQVVQEPSAEIAESPQEIDLRNTKETAMLKRNLGGFSEIPVHNLLYDANQLRSLAQLQESLEWFSKSLLSLVTGLKASNAARFGMAHLPKLSENSIQTLTSRALEFEELSDTCLLVLHLEVRVHCFHYLHSIWKGPAGAQFFGGHESTEPNMQVCEKNLLDIRFSKPCQKIGFSKANYMVLNSPKN